MSLAVVGYDALTPHQGGGDITVLALSFRQAVQDERIGALQELSEGLGSRPVDDLRQLLEVLDIADEQFLMEEDDVRLGSQRFTRKAKGLGPILLDGSRFAFLLDDGDSDGRGVPLNCTGDKAPLYNKETSHFPEDFFAPSGCAPTCSTGAGKDADCGSGSTD